GNGGSQSSPQTLVNGQVSFTYPALPRGLHTITATYSGDTNTAPGSTHSSLNEQVNVDPTTTAVVPSANPALVGQSVTFTATVSPTQGATGTPTGTVSFVIDGGNSSTVTLTTGHAA